MADVASSLACLEEIADELARRGDQQLTEKTRAVVADLRSATAPPELISVDEAAKLLGIRSTGMVMRWARERRRQGFSVGGRVRVSRRSVEKLFNSPIVVREQEYEQELAEVLDAFDVGEGPVPESELPHMGGAPWDSVAPAQPDASASMMLTNAAPWRSREDGRDGALTWSIGAYF